MTPHPPHAIFEIAGFQWDSWKHPRLFERVSAELSTGECSEAVCQFFDPHFQIVNKYAGLAGEAASLPVIRVWLGFGENLGEPIFKGLLARIERGESSTTFRAYDMSFRMRLIKKTEYHKGEDLAIIAKLAKRNQLQFVGPAKPIKLEPHRAMPQDQQSDWEHVAERAREAGLVLWTRHDTLFADYPAKTHPNDSVKHILVYQQDFSILRNFDLSFKVPENVEGRPKQVKVHGRAKGGKRLTGESDAGDRGTEQLSIKRDLPIHSKQHANRRAQAQKDLEREHAFQISISTISQLPAKRIDVRDTIWLKELGELFGGKYLVDRLRHELSPGRLTTSFELYRDAN